MNNGVIIIYRGLGISILRNCELLSKHSKNIDESEMTIDEKIEICDMCDDNIYHKKILPKYNWKLTKWS